MAHLPRHLLVNPKINQSSIKMVVFCFCGLFFCLCPVSCMPNVASLRPVPCMPNVASLRPVSCMPNVASLRPEQDLLLHYKSSSMSLNDRQEIST
jgi:hypothetical protein